MVYEALGVVATFAAFLVSWNWPEVTARLCPPPHPQHVDRGRPPARTAFTPPPRLPDPYRPTVPVRPQEPIPAPPTVETDPTVPMWVLEASRWQHEALVKQRAELDAKRRAACSHSGEQVRVLERRDSMCVDCGTWVDTLD